MSKEANKDNEENNFPRISAIFPFHHRGERWKFQLSFEIDGFADEILRFLRYLLFNVCFYFRRVASTTTLGPCRRVHGGSGGAKTTRNPM